MSVLLSYVAFHRPRSCSQKQMKMSNTVTLSTNYTREIKPHGMHQPDDGAITRFEDYSLHARPPDDVLEKTVTLTDLSVEQDISSPYEITSSKKINGELCYCICCRDSADWHLRRNLAIVSQLAMKSTDEPSYLAYQPMFTFLPCPRIMETTHSRVRRVKKHLTDFWCGKHERLDHAPNELAFSWEACFLPGRMKLTYNNSRVRDVEVALGGRHRMSLSFHWNSHPEFTARSFFYGKKSVITTELMNPEKPKRDYRDLMQRSRGLDFETFRREIHFLARGAGTRFQRLKSPISFCDETAEEFLSANEAEMKMDKSLYLSRAALTQKITLPVWQLLNLWKFGFNTSKPVVDLPTWASWFWDVKLPHLGMDTVEEHLHCFECFQSSLIMGPGWPLMIKWHGQPAITWFTGCFHMQVLCVRMVNAYFMKEPPCEEGPVVMELINCRKPEDI